MIVYWTTKKNDDSRFQDLNEWSRHFVDIGEAIDLILNFIRNSNIVTKEIALTGFFPITLDTNLPNQLLCVSLEMTQPYFVEISGGKHRCTIRFMSPSDGNQRPRQTAENVPFTLTRCTF